MEGFNETTKYIRYKLGFKTIVNVKPKYNNLFHKLIHLLRTHDPSAEIMALSEENKKRSDLAGAARLNNYPKIDNKEFHVIEIPEYIGSPWSLYVMAHEVAHVILGHFDRRRRDEIEEICRGRIITYMMIQRLSYHYEKQEFDADEWAFLFLKENGIKATTKIYGLE